MIVAAIPEKRLYTEDEAGIYLGYPAVFERVKSAGWIARADKSGIFKCRSMTARTWTNALGCELVIAPGSNSLTFFGVANRGGG